MHVLFAGDFFQLKPVGSKPLYLYTEFELWQRDVHTFMELKTNHRFIEDPEHGRLLDKYRSNMFQKEDAEVYNKRVITSENNLSENDMPEDTVIAVQDNKDRDAIHDAMFLKHLHNTHSKDPTKEPPTHTICVLASDMKWKMRRFEYTAMSNYGRDIVYGACSSNHVRSAQGDKCIDPLLKLYEDCTLMVTENINVRTSGRSS